MLIPGIIGGLTAASLQTVAYLTSRSYLTAGGSVTALWARSQTWMLVAAIPLTIGLWRQPEAGWSALLLAVLGSCGGYLGAQWCLIHALRGVAVSRLAPLLGVKIPFLAVLALAVGETTIGPWRWGAVILALIAAVVIQFAGVRLRPLQIIALIGCVAGYAIADVSISMMSRAITSTPSLASIGWSLGLVYVLCGVVMLPLLPRATKQDNRGWRACLPYAITWLAAMASLFCAIAWLGVVPAIILQALRGPLSVLIGQWVARRGHHHLETPLSWGDVVRQIAAATLMVAATAMWVGEERLNQLFTNPSP